MGKKLYKVLFGEYAGRIGTVESVNPKTNLAMFYPIEKIHPYRVALHIKQIGNLDAEVCYDRQRTGY